MAHPGQKKTAAAADELQTMRLELEELRRENEYFRSVLKNFRNGLLTVDNNLEIIFFNRTVERLLGYTPDELQGMKLSRLIQAEEEVVLDILRRGGFCVDPKTGEMGSFSFVTKSGGIFPVEACFSVITDRNRQICGMTCSFRDVTQKRRMEKAMARMDRLASLGEMASGMAHEIKNPLACIAGVMQNLQFADPDAGGAELVPEVLSQVEKIDSIINALLHFAHPGSMEMAALELGDVVAAALALVERQLRENDIALKLNGMADAIRVRGDKQLLQQAFLNIFMNACEALAEMDGERRLEVACRCRRYVDHSDPAMVDSPLEYVEIEIRDNGCGIERGHLDSVFNPFFTTKYRGAGLGLATAHRIMEQHEGTITVDSSASGTVFKLSLPLCRD